MSIKSKLKEIEKSINERQIDFRTDDYMHSVLEMKFFEIKEYKALIVELNKVRYSSESFADKEALVDDYKKIYLSSKKIYIRMKKNIEEDNMEILYNDELNSNTEYLSKMLDSRIDYEFGETPYDNIKRFVYMVLRYNINVCNNELYKLKHKKYEYINTDSTYINSTSVFRYRSDMVFYKDVFIAATETHSFSVFYNQNTSIETKNTILNMLAYLNGRPYFYFTENPTFNRKLDDLYENFDLLDILRLRKKDFFYDNEDEPIHIELPILKTHKDYDFISFEESNHEMIFELYHASLKQFEAMPRCVFLFRVFEYGVQHHYQRLFPGNTQPSGMLDYYADEVLNHNFNAHYFLDIGRYRNDYDELIEKRKPRYVSFPTALKGEAKKIVEEWKVHPYLQNKTIGQVIYLTGRNAAAHGGGGQRNARYDYDRNYKHINDVNIFLELIARYLIETLHPSLNNATEKRKMHYIKTNRYERLFGLVD